MLAPPRLHVYVGEAAEAPRSEEKNSNLMVIDLRNMMLLFAVLRRCKGLSHLQPQCPLQDDITLDSRLLNRHQPNV